MMEYIIPFKKGDIIAELGGGEKPIFRPNIDVRQLSTVDIVADFNKPLPILDQNYNGIFCKYLLEHLSWRRVKPFLKEIHRIVKPGGTVIFITANLLEQAKVLINTPNWDENILSMLFGGQRFDENKDFDEQWDNNAHHNGFSPEYVTRLLTDIGFQEVKITPIQTDVGPTDMIVETKKPSISEIIVNKNNLDGHNNHPYNRAYFDGDSKIGYHPPGYSNFPSNYTVANEILKQLNISNIPRVLELGGCRGYISNILDRKGINATCLDISRHCWHTRACKNFVLADATERLPFKDKEFDLVFSKDFLEHIPEEKIDNLIKDMIRVSRQGFHLVTFSDHPYANDDSTHRCLKHRDWWIEKFKKYTKSESSSEPSSESYHYIIEDKEKYEHTDLNTIMRFHSPTNISRVNVGSFTQMYYGWENWDILNLKDWASSNGFLFDQVDITKHLPKIDNTIELINCSHTLEHVTREEGLSFLRECYRILKPEGILRLAIPDTRIICESYMHNKIKYYGDFNIGVEKSKDESQALYHMLIEGHKTIYDFDSLKLILENAGFSDIMQMKFLESRNPIIEKEVIDMYPEISTYVECIKCTNFINPNHNSNPNSDSILKPIKPIITKGSIEELNKLTETNKNTQTNTQTKTQTTPINETNKKFKFSFKFSIVYMTYRPGGFDILLSSLINQTYKNYELIIVDDYPGRSEIIKPIFEYHKIPLKYFGPSKSKCYPDTLHGWSNAINTGSLLSSGDVIIILQDYTYLPQDALENWNMAFNENGLDTIICGGARMFTGPIPQNWKGFFTVWDQPINEDISKLPNFIQKEEWIPEKYEVCYTGIPHKIMEQLNGFDEHFDDRPNGGETHEFFGRVEIAGYKVSVNRNLLCHMIDHRSWHPPDHNDDHLWYITRLENLRNKPSTGIRWEDSIRDIKEGRKSIRAENCFEIKKEIEKTSEYHKPLKIALISTPFFTVPPKNYGGLEQVIWDLACGLDELGHEVTIFGPEGSKSTHNGHLVITGLGLDTVNVDWFEEEKKRYNYYNDLISPDKFDVVIDSTWFGFAYLMKIKNPRLKIIHLHHGGYNWDSLPPLGNGKPNLVAISQWMRQYTIAYFKKKGFDVNCEYVYNSVNLDRYVFDPDIKKTNRLLYLGRFSMLKGAHTAISIAKKANLPIDLIGSTFIDDINYLKEIESMCHEDNICIYKDASHDFKIKKLQEAKALLVPSRFQEPFGLICIEGMSCGCPIVAYRDGAIPEVVLDKRTGYICDNEDQMVEAIKNIDNIDHLECRKRAEEFSILRMARSYDKLCYRVLKGDEW